MNRIKLLLLVFFTFLVSYFYAQCPFTFNFFGSGTAPAPGFSQTQQTCSFIGEAITTTGVVAGDSYLVDVTYSGFPSISPFVVIYDSNFAPIASGQSPLTFTAPSNGTYYTIPFADNFCSTFDPNFGCNTTVWSNSPGANYQNEVVCFDYTWPVNNQTYTTSGVYVDSIFNGQSYDVYSLNLTVTSVPFNLSLINSSNTLTSQSNSGTYQWIDCSTGLPLAGETNQSFTPTQTGSYAAVISSGNCVDTSVCESVFIPITETATGCFLYLWSFNNQVYSSSGIYVDSVPVLGGYQVATLDLTLGYPPTNLTVINSGSTLTAVAPSPYYQWIDCANNLPVAGATNQSYSPNQTGNYAVILTDGVCSDTSICETIFVPITDSAAVCEDYTWSFNNQTYATSGVYVDSVPTLGGYQVATLNLTIGFDPSNLLVVDSAGVLYSQSNFGNYQWIDCATNLPISGATNQLFEPTITGSYAVIVSDGVCSDTSACTTVQVDGLSVLSNLNLSIMPNPTNDKVTVVFEGYDVQLEISDTKGKVVYSEIIQNGESVDLSSFNSGVYVFHFESSEGREIRRVVRQ